VDAYVDAINVSSVCLPAFGLFCLTLPDLVCLSRSDFDACAHAQDYNAAGKTAFYAAAPSFRIYLQCVQSCELILDPAERARYANFSWVPLQTNRTETVSKPRLPTARLKPLVRVCALVPWQPPPYVRMPYSRKYSEWPAYKSAVASAPLFPALKYVPPHFLQPKPVGPNASYVSTTTETVHFDLRVTRIMPGSGEEREIDISAARTAELEANRVPYQVTLLPWRPLWQIGEEQQSWYCPEQADECRQVPAAQFCRSSPCCVSPSANFHSAWVWPSSASACEARRHPSSALCCQDCETLAQGEHQYVLVPGYTRFTCAVSHLTTGSPQALVVYRRMFECRHVLAAEARRHEPCRMAP
jgi:hypothetical protein